MWPMQLRDPIFNFDKLNLSSYRWLVNRQPGLHSSSPSPPIQSVTKLSGVHQEGLSGSCNDRGGQGYSRQGAKARARWERPGHGRLGNVKEQSSCLWVQTAQWKSRDGGGWVLHGETMTPFMIPGLGLNMRVNGELGAEGGCHRNEPRIPKTPQPCVG